jgi:hypothetical protein
VTRTYRAVSQWNTSSGWWTSQPQRWPQTRSPASPASPMVAGPRRRDSRRWARDAAATQCKVWSSSPPPTQAGPEDLQNQVEQIGESNSDQPECRIIDRPMSAGASDILSHIALRSYMAIMSKGSTMRAGSGQRTNIDDLWRPDHPVLEILRQRRQSGSRPGGRTPDDTAKVGLAVEGGGMRGVVSAAMLQVIEESGLHLAFDAVYGCSSGAINAAYYLAGDTWYPVSIYFHD